MRAIQSTKSLVQEQPKKKRRKKASKSSEGKRIREKKRLVRLHGSGGGKLTMMSQPKRTSAKRTSLFGKEKFHEDKGHDGNSRPDIVSRRKGKKKTEYPIKSPRQRREGKKKEKKRKKGKT